jgi:uncharacterized membrane protein
MCLETTRQKQTRQRQRADWGKKITIVVIVLTAFTFFGRFNIFQCGPWTHIFFSKKLYR